MTNLKVFEKIKKAVESENYVVMIRGCFLVEDVTIINDELYAYYDGSINSLDLKDVNFFKKVVDIEEIEL